MEPTRYHTSEFNKITDLLRVVAKLRRHYGEMFIEVKPDEDINVGSLQGKGRLPRLPLTSAIQLLGVSASVDFRAEDCSPAFLSRFYRGSLKSPLFVPASKVRSFVDVDAGFDTNKKEDVCKYKMGAMISDGPEQEEREFEISHSPHLGGKPPDQSAVAIKRMIEAGLPVTLKRRRGDYFVEAGSGAVRFETNGEPNRFTFGCFLPKQSPEQFASLFYQCVQARAGEMKVDWQWCFDRDCDEEHPERAPLVYQWFAEQDFPSERYEVLLKYRVTGLEALPFLKSISGRKSYLELEVGQIQWPDDWYAILKVAALPDGFQLIVGLKHDPQETRKVLSEIQRAAGVRLEMEK